MVQVRVPATSANLGAGFDALGIALTLYNDVFLELSDHADIASLDGLEIPTDESNMIYENAKHFYDICGKPFYGLKIRQRSRIPMTRGLGSSSACIVAALLGANRLLGDPMNRDEILSLAAHLEGHPDNVAPAICGGLVAAVIDHGQVVSVSVPVSKSLRFAALIPNFELKTSFARSILPDTLTRADAVFNLSRAALMTAAMFSGDTGALRVAAQDRIHQPTRLGLIPGSRTAFEAAYRLGAHGVYLSGAGPTLIAIISSSDRTFEKRMEEEMRREGFTGWRVEMLDCDQNGAQVTLEDTANG